MDIEGLKKRLREHYDERLYQEADALMFEAANAIEQLQRELEEAHNLNNQALDYLEKRLGKLGGEANAKMQIAGLATRLRTARTHSTKD